MKKIILNKANILLLLLVVTLVLLMVAILRLKVTSVKEGSSQNNAVEKITINKEEYKKNIFNVLDEYEQVITAADIYDTSARPSFGSDDLIFQQIDDLKNKIVGLKAPSMEYKDLHMNLVLSLLSIKDYLEAPASQKNVVCIDYVKKVKKSRELLLD
ncbi:hypothetical protein L6270_04595 [Candidatus Parcubacteria bacterium]|nr:hypothetical protein [Patescibacteria group bacterium]MBU4309241.1 hypothetical protein [Patescibacteria group bacterium]MBU4432315.1 hypothetical protein [Patescibacteria group bacterium]MBU4577602.1 hypothetical protein [Patescibacteria group bacterium]MCG2697289.1 hypothetical protein [Candidatus Parcubacteria bacterium]